MNHHSLVILLLLIAVLIAIAPRWRHADWVLALITLTGLMFIEFGLLIPVVITALALAKAPNATRRTVLGAWIALLVYAAVRLAFTTQTAFPIAYTETGIGFEIVDRADLNRMFANAPWLFWAYNVIATFLNVVLSEPRSGVYYFVDHVLKGATTNWLWLHVISSAAGTAIIIWALIGREIASARDRQLLWLGGTLVVCGSALGALYVRDRIGLPVGFGYAILLYVGASRLLERPPRLLGSVGLTAVLLALMAAWLVRDAEAWFQVRDTAWERRLEWTERYAELGGPKEPQTSLLDQLRVAGLSRSVSDPRRDPIWTYAWFERRVDPLDD